MPRASPFTTEQETWIVVQYGQLNSIIKVKRKFRNHYKLSPHNIPDQKQFARVVDRFLERGNVQHKKSSGRPVSQVTDENARRVKDIIENDSTKSIRQISTDLNLSVWTVWQLLRRTLKLFPYKPKNVQPLTQQHRDQRLEFCNWVLTKPQVFMDKVIWTDEKLWGGEGQAQQAEREDLGPGGPRS